MTREKLEEIEKLIADYRNRALSLKTGDMVHLATLLERTKRKRGKHLMYKSPLPGQRAVPITGHPSDTIGKLAYKMIGQLESDIDAWKAELERQERARAKGNGHGD